MKSGHTMCPGRKRRHDRVHLPPGGLVRSRIRGGAPRRGSAGRGHRARVPDVRRRSTRSAAPARCISNVDLMWEWPPSAWFLRRLGSFARVVVMDRRGYGCSERFSPDALVPLEVMMDDVVAILDVAGIERVAVFVYEDGGTLHRRRAAKGPDVWQRGSLSSNGPARQLVGFSHTDTWVHLRDGYTSRSHPAQRSRSLRPAR